MSSLLLLFFSRKTQSGTLAFHDVCCSGGLQEVTTGSCPLKVGEQVLNETLIADSSNHSLYLVKISEIQLSWEKLRTEPASERHETNDLHVSIATSHHGNVSLSGILHHLSGSDMFALTRCAVCVLCVM